MTAWIARNYDVCFWSSLVMGVATILLVWLTYGTIASLVASAVLHLPAKWFINWLYDNKKEHYRGT